MCCGQRLQSGPKAPALRAVLKQRSPGSLWGFGQVEVTLQPAPCLEIPGETPTSRHFAAKCEEIGSKTVENMWRTCGEHVVDVEEHIVLKLETFYILGCHLTSSTGR